MRGSPFDEDFEDRARRFRPVGAPSIWQLLRYPSIYLPTLVFVALLLSWGGWLISKDISSRSAEFQGVIVRLVVPKERSGLVGRSQSAHVTVRQMDGSTLVWEVEPLVGSYLREEDFVIKERWKKVAVFRGGRQLTSGFPFRRDEVALPSPQTAP